MPQKIKDLINLTEEACAGNWEVYYPIPMDRGGYDTFEILREGLDLKLKELLAVCYLLFF